MSPKLRSFFEPYIIMPWIIEGWNLNPEPFYLCSFSEILHLFTFYFLTFHDIFVWKLSYLASLALLVIYEYLQYFERSFIFWERIFSLSIFENVFFLSHASLGEKFSFPEKFLENPSLFWVFSNRSGFEYFCFLSKWRRSETSFISWNFPSIIKPTKFLKTYYPN